MLKIKTERLAGGSRADKVCTRDLQIADVTAWKVSHPITRLQRIEVVRLNNRDEPLIPGGAIFHERQCHSDCVKTMPAMPAECEPLVHVQIFPAEMHSEFVVEQRRPARIPPVTRKFVPVQNRVAVIAFVQCLDNELAR